MKPYLGTPTSRVDGRAKVTGLAQYAGEFQARDLAHGAVVTSIIAKGHIRAIDASRALAVPGVLSVVTHENRPKMAGTDKAYSDDVAPGGSPYRPLYDNAIKFSHQPVALVIAEDWETARFAATLVQVDYAEENHATDLCALMAKAHAVKKPDKQRGNAAKAFASASVRHEAEYSIPTEHHNPMELFASAAVWQGAGKLTVYDKTQGVQNVQRYLCSVFGLNSDDVTVRSPFVGGAFGGALRPQYQLVLAVQGALALRRSVRVVLTRDQMYGLGYRPASIERIKLGAKPDGTLESVSHEAITMTSHHEDFSRNDVGWSAQLYKTPNAHYEHKLVKLDVPTPADMRAPGATTGVYALECAMDELAFALKIDPLELRKRCYSDRDQNTGHSFTSKQLLECYRKGAEEFGWSKRTPEPRSIRDGSDLVGLGMATGIWEALQMPIATRIVMTSNGHAEVSCATADIGTGTYTIMSQLAADMLGLPIDNVTVKLGDSTLPQSPVEGGSWTAASVSHAIAATARDMRGELLRLAQDMKDSPLAGLQPDDVILADGMIVDNERKGRSVSVASAMRHGGIDRIEHEQSAEFDEKGKHAHNTHSAIFAEVKIDEELGVIRVTRVVNAVAAGRIINTKTAASQIMGGVVWGIGMALHEETLMDHKFGRVMNANIAEYHVPVHADIHDIKVIFVDEPDNLINQLGIKGVGEIGLVGVAAAIANAVYHATGKRVRDLPITLDKLMR